MDIVEILNKLKLYKNNQELLKNEKQKFFEFINRLKQSRKIQFIYRGDSKLREHYKVEVSDVTLLSHYIFAIGEKGYFFLKKHRKKETNQFQFIWNKLNEKICELRFESESNKQIVCEFLGKNVELKDFFSTAQNKEQFLNCDRLDEKQRKQVIDYYIALLHTIGKSGIDDSYFLSSTLDKNIAEYFKNGGIVIYGWLPKKGQKDCMISYEDINGYNNTIEQLGLPIYEVSLYPEQKEICLKCGLLPNYIIGFQYEQNFYINPAIIETEINDKLITHGFDILQKDFNNTYNKTNYKKHFIFYDGIYYVFDNDNKIEISL